MLANGKHRRSSLAVSTGEWSEKTVKSKDRKFPNLVYSALLEENKKINKTEKEDGKYISY